MPLKLIPSVGFMIVPGSLVAVPTVPPVICDAAVFDGVNDYMSRAIAMSGALDTKRLTVSLWIYVDSYPAETKQVLEIGDSNDIHLGIQLGDTGGLLFLSRNTSTFADVAYASSETVPLAQDAWNHVAWSYDAALPNGGQRLRVNTLEALTVLNHVDAIVNWSSAAAFSVGAASAAAGGTPGSFRLACSLAEVYIAPGVYIDLDVASNLEKFRTLTGKASDIGTDGSVPTGSPPLIYLHLDDAESAANFATNRSGAGNFTVTGSLATAGTSPSD